MKRCRHNSAWQHLGATVYAPHRTDAATGSCGPGWTTVPGRLVCAGCGITLPLGPARDTPETAVEVRAAWLAETMRDHKDGRTTCDRLASDAEWDGVVVHKWPYLPDPEKRPSDAFWAGYLAHAIATHEEE